VESPWLLDLQRMEIPTRLVVEAPTLFVKANEGIDIDMGLRECHCHFNGVVAILHGKIED